MLDILASFAQNEFRTLLLMVCAILATGTYYYLFCIIIGDPMQPTITKRKVRKLVKIHGKTATQKYLQSIGKRLQDYI